MEIKVYLMCMSFNYLKHSDKDVKTLKTNPGLGGNKRLEIQKQFQKFMKCCPEIVKCP